ncbi:hypoxanthine phosphoribosyltransferase [Echinicola jeungdonensis]|uniref:Hypoxanthine phosphoribosyltransferase n=1 Tax=Echinicola jeungdonensis TaxID=709343 RepID=A0ABV5J1M3_9BACT|nr:hypoxanthine phosphoribosyltransferase [Echinicola jeungdonensis]MDN3668554.1 hypoxanthine phosphoribosyltransferase [Echinicola jeungdonensis]
MITLKDKQFVSFIPEEDLKKRVAELGDQLTTDYKGKTPLVIGVLNGSFMFLSDLLKKIDLEVEVSFVKISSYESMSSTGKINGLIGLNEELEGREVLIVEDIVDTGRSIEHMLKAVKEKKPKNVAVVSLLFKPKALRAPVDVEYIGFEIPNKFVVGYGMDYEGVGRNIKEIYQLK